MSDKENENIISDNAENSDENSKYRTASDDISDCLEIISQNPINTAELRAAFKDMNPVDVADVFEKFSSVFEDSAGEKTVHAFRLLSKDEGAEVFAYMHPEVQQTVIEALTDGEIGRIINELFIDDAVDFIEEMPANVVKRVLQNVSEETRQTINQILNYPEDSAGSHMTTEYVDLREDMTVSEAFSHIRATGVDKETIYTCYVIRFGRFLTGVISVKTLLLSDHSNRICDIMDDNFIVAHTTDDRETVAALFSKYDLLSLPVVDKEERLVGIITVDDVVQIIEEEATEDFEKMSALSPSDESYLKTSIFKLASNRIVWLLVLMLSATLTGGIISNFENSMSALPALIAFIPMLMGTGGNAGAQASTLIIRGIALGEIRSRDIFKVLFVEFRVALICGAVLAAINYARVYFITDKGDVKLSFTVSLSLMATVLMAKIVGCTLPLAAKKLKLDPAIMAAPIITTILDATSLLVFFSIAKAVMGI